MTKAHTTWRRHARRAEGESGCGGAERERARARAQGGPLDRRPRASCSATALARWEHRVRRSGRHARRAARGAHLVQKGRAAMEHLDERRVLGGRRVARVVLDPALDGRGGVEELHEQAHVLGRVGALGRLRAEPRSSMHPALVANLANLYQMTSSPNTSVGPGASSKPTLERLVMATAPDDFDLGVLNLGGQ